MRTTFITSQRHKDANVDIKASKHRLRAAIENTGVGVFVGQGFIAIAAVIFGKFSPGGAAKACLLFGFCSGVKSILSMSNVIDPNLISMIPYVVTIIALILFVGKAHTPAANGKPFVKSK